METRDIIKRDEYTAQSQQTSTHRPVRMHWAWAYLLISWVFLICVVVQVFLAGLAIFMNWSYFEWHASFAHFFELLPLVLIGLAFVSRLPRSLRWLPTVAFLLIIVQYATAEMPRSFLSALHTVSALFIFWCAVNMALKARGSVRAMPEE
jgi:hypothetical protein